MKKKYIACTGLLSSLMFIIISNISYSYADVSSTIWGGASAASNAGESIIGIIMWICVAVLIGAVIYKGIKFVTASPDGKAEIKNEIIMIVVGGLLIFGILMILNIVLSLVKKAGLQ